jgi:hypothetical protein
MGFQFLETNGKELGSLEDLYQSYTEGFPGDQLSYLSLKLSFDKTDTVMREGKEYLLKVRMFDKKGNKELLMELPFKRTPKTQINYSVMTGKSALGPGINSSFVNASVKKMELMKNGKKELWESMVSNQPYVISLSELEGLKGKLNYQFKFVDLKGVSSKMKEGTTSGGTNAKIEISTEKLEPGEYILWFRAYDTGGNSLAVTAPVKIAW